MVAFCFLGIGINIDSFRYVGQYPVLYDYEWRIFNFLISRVNNGRNGSCLTWLATSLEEKRRWLTINASLRGQSSK